MKSAAKSDISVWNKDILHDCFFFMSIKKGNVDKHLVLVTKTLPHTQTWVPGVYSVQIKPHPGRKETFNHKFSSVLIQDTAYCLCMKPAVWAVRSDPDLITASVLLQAKEQKYPETEVQLDQNLSSPRCSLSLWLHAVQIWTHNEPCHEVHERIRGKCACWDFPASLFPTSRAFNPIFGFQI